jgi:hypothetical protein
MGVGKARDSLAAETDWHALNPVINNAVSSGRSRDIRRIMAGLDDGVMHPSDVRCQRYAGATTMDAGDIDHSLPESAGLPVRMLRAG